jgi:hypothetical protein
MLAAVYWILATILVLSALAVPRLRPFALVGGVVLGGLLAWGVVHRWLGNEPGAGQTVQERGRSASPAEVLQSAPLADVSVQNVALTGGGAPFELRGRIENRSTDLRLRSVTVLITRRDCYEGALDPTGCALLWQDRHWTAVSVPPGQSREFASSIWMRGAAPRPRGKVQDSFEIVAATGSPAAEVEANEE